MAFSAPDGVESCRQGREPLVRSRRPQIPAPEGRHPRINVTPNGVRGNPWAWSHPGVCTLIVIHNSTAPFFAPNGALVNSQWAVLRPWSGNRPRSSRPEWGGGSRCRLTSPRTASPALRSTIAPFGARNRLTIVIQGRKYRPWLSTQAPFGAKSQTTKLCITMRQGTSPHRRSAEKTATSKAKSLWLSFKGLPVWKGRGRSQDLGFDG